MLTTIVERRIKVDIIAGVRTVLVVVLCGGGGEIEANEERYLGKI